VGRGDISQSSGRRLVTCLELFAGGRGLPIDGLGGRGGGGTGRLGGGGLGFDRNPFGGPFGGGGLDGGGGAIAAMPFKRKFKICRLSFTLDTGRSFQTKNLYMEIFS